MEDENCFKKFSVSIRGHHGPAAKDPRLFGVRWWHRREWAKITFNEWLKVIWWNCIDRWR